MQVTEDDVREFQELWQEEFRESISVAEARQRASELLELYALLARAPWVEPDVSDEATDASASQDP